MSSGSGRFSLSWNEFESGTTKTFNNLLLDTNFTNVTLVCEDDRQINAHKVILASCSPFFMRILLKNPHNNPLIYLKGVKYLDLQAIINFIYLGQAEIKEEHFQRFMDSAKDLEINGIVEGVSSTGEETASYDQHSDNILPGQYFEHKDEKSEVKLVSVKMEDNLDETTVNIDINVEPMYEHKLK